MVALADSYECGRPQLNHASRRPHSLEMLSNTNNESYYNRFDNKLYYYDNTSSNNNSKYFFSSSIITDDTDIIAGFGGVVLSDRACMHTPGNTTNGRGNSSFDVDMLKRFIEKEEERGSNHNTGNTIVRAAHISSSCTGNGNGNGNGTTKRHGTSSVRFSDVTIQEYPIQPGTNPGGTIGCPITIGWEPIGLPVTVSVNMYEHFRSDKKYGIRNNNAYTKTNTNTNNRCYFENGRNNNEADGGDEDDDYCIMCARRSSSGLTLVSAHREHILKKLGYSNRSIRAGTKSANQARRLRYNTIARLKSSKAEEFLESLWKTVRNMTTFGWEQRRERAYLAPFILSSSSSSSPISPSTSKAGMDYSTGTTTARD